MGLETALMIGFSALQAVSTIGAAKDQAKDTIAEGKMVAENKARETRLKADRARSSFLSSGITLEGTPMSALDDIYDTGLADIGQIGKNYSTQANNQLKAGRSEALGQFASGFSGMSLESSAFNPITSNLPMGKFGGGYGYYGSSSTRIDWQ